MALIQITEVGPESMWGKNAVGLVLDVPLQHIYRLPNSSWDGFRVEPYPDSCIPIISKADWGLFGKSIWVYQFKYRILFREPGDKKSCA